MPGIQYYSMESDSAFESIMLARQSAHELVVETERRMLDMRTTYQETTTSSVFGMDTFHFQCKLLDAELSDLKRHLSLINNRMYCEYYKLYRLMSEYVKSLLINCSNIDLSSFVAYKDLEPYKVYEPSVVSSVNSEIARVLGLLRAHVEEKERELAPHRDNQDRGMNVNNFVMTLTHHIQIVQEKIRLFESHLAIFHELQRTRFGHFREKLDILRSRIVVDDVPEEHTAEVEINMEIIYG